MSINRAQLDDRMTLPCRGLSNYCRSTLITLQQLPGTHLAFITGSFCSAPVRLLNEGASKTNKVLMEDGRGV